ADVLDRVVDVHLDIAAGFHDEVHEAVFGPGLEHVAEERDRRANLRRPRAVDVELEPDLGLLRLSLHPPLPAFRLAAHAPEAPFPLRTCAAVPCPARPSMRVKARR